MDKDSSRKARSFWSELEKGSDDRSSTSPSLGSGSSPGSMLNSPSPFPRPNRFGTPSQSIRQNVFVQSDQQFQQQQQHFQSYQQQQYHSQQYQQQQQHHPQHHPQPEPQHYQVQPMQYPSQRYRQPEHLPYPYPNNYHPLTYNNLPAHRHTASTPDSLFSSPISNQSNDYYSRSPIYSPNYINQQQQQQQTQFRYNSVYSHTDYGFDGSSHQQHFNRLPTFDFGYNEQIHRPLPNHYPHQLPHRPSQSPQPSQPFRVASTGENIYLNTSAFNQRPSEQQSVPETPSTPTQPRPTHPSIYATPPRYTNPITTPGSVGTLSSSSNISSSSPTKSALKKPGSTDTLSNFSPSPSQGDNSLKTSPHKKAAAFFRKGSLGRLLNPKTSSPSATSDKRGKKNVSFVKTAPEIIQYEALTPEISFASSPESSNATDEDNDSDDESYASTPKTLSIDGPFHSSTRHNTTSNSDSHFRLQTPPSLQNNDDDIQEDDSMSNVPIIEPPELMSPTLLSMKQMKNSQVNSSFEENDEMYGFYQKVTSNDNQQSQQYQAESPESSRRPLPQVPKHLQGFSNSQQHLKQSQFGGRINRRLPSIENYIKTEPVAEVCFPDISKQRQDSGRDMNTYDGTETADARFIQPILSPTYINQKPFPVKIKPEPENDIVYIKPEPKDDAPLYRIPVFSRAIPQVADKSEVNKGASKGTFNAANPKNDSLAANDPLSFSQPNAASASQNDTAIRTVPGQVFSTDQIVSTLEENPPHESSVNPFGELRQGTLSPVIESNRDGDSGSRERSNVGLGKILGKQGRSQEENNQQLVVEQPVDANQNINNNLIYGHGSNTEKTNDTSSANCTATESLPLNNVSIQPITQTKLSSDENSNNDTNSQASQKNIPLPEAHKRTSISENQSTQTNVRLQVQQSTSLEANIPEAESANRTVRVKQEPVDEGLMTTKIKSEPVDESYHFGNKSSNKQSTRPIEKETPQTTEAVIPVQPVSTPTIPDPVLTTAVPAPSTPESDSVNDNDQKHVEQGSPALQVHSNTVSNINYPATTTPVLPVVSRLGASSVGNNTDQMIYSQLKQTTPETSEYYSRIIQPTPQSLVNSGFPAVPIQQGQGFNSERVNVAVDSVLINSHSALPLPSTLFNSKTSQLLTSNQNTPKGNNCSPSSLASRDEYIDNERSRLVTPVNSNILSSNAGGTPMLPHVFTQISNTTNNITTERYRSIDAESPISQHNSHPAFDPSPSIPEIPTSFNMYYQHRPSSAGYRSLDLRQPLNYDAPIGLPSFSLPVSQSSTMIPPAYSTFSPFEYTSFLTPPPQPPQVLTALSGHTRSVSDSFNKYQKPEPNHPWPRPVSQLSETAVYTDGRTRWDPNSNNLVPTSRKMMSQQAGGTKDDHNADRQFAKQNVATSFGKDTQEGENVSNVLGSKEPVSVAASAPGVDSDPGFDKNDDEHTIVSHRDGNVGQESLSLKTNDSSNLSSVSSKKHQQPESLLNQQSLPVTIKQEEPDGNTLIHGSPSPFAKTKEKTSITGVAAVVAATSRINQEETSVSIQTPPDRTIPRFETHEDGRRFKELQNRELASLQKRRGSSLAFETRFTSDEEELDTNDDIGKNDTQATRSSPRSIPNASIHSPQDFKVPETPNPLLDLQSATYNKLNPSNVQILPHHTDLGSQTFAKSSEKIPAQAKVSKSTLLSPIILQEAEARHQNITDAEVMSHSSQLGQVVPTVPVAAVLFSDLEEQKIAKNLETDPQELSTEEPQGSQSASDKLADYKKAGEDSTIGEQSDQHGGNRNDETNAQEISKVPKIKQEENTRNSFTQSVSHLPDLEALYINPNELSTVTLKSEVSPVGEFGFKNADAYDYEHANQLENDNSDKDIGFDQGSENDGEGFLSDEYDFDPELEDFDEESNDGTDSENHAGNDKDEKSSNKPSIIVAKGTKMKARRSLIPHDVSVSKLIELNNQTVLGSSPVPPVPPIPATAMDVDILDSTAPSKAFDYDYVFGSLGLGSSSDTNGIGMPLPKDTTSTANDVGVLSASKTSISTIQEPTTSRAETSRHRKVESLLIPDDASPTKGQSSKTDSQPLLSFDINDSASESMFDDLYKEFDKMLGDSPNNKKKGKDFSKSEEVKRHGYFVRETTDIVVASAQQRRRKSQTNSTTHNLNNTNVNAIMIPHGSGNQPEKFKGGGINEEISNRNKRKVSGPFRHLVDPVDSSDKKENKSNSSENKNEKVGEQEKEDTKATAQEAKEELSTKPKYHKSSEVFSTDRGRLFARIISIDNIQTLPNIDIKNAKVCMILDNGVHSITTPYKPMQKSVTMLDHEFELVVGQTLEFILTFRAKWPKPKEISAAIQLPQSHSLYQPSSSLLVPPRSLPNPTSAPHLTNSTVNSRNVSTASAASGASQFLKPTSSVASSVSSRKRHGLSKFFSRNKGDKEKNSGGNSAQQLRQKRITPVQSARMGNVTSNSESRQSSYQSVKQMPDPWEKYVAQDGSFARAYVSLSQFENEIFGVAKQISIVCYNEWTTISGPPTTGVICSPTQHTISKTEKQTPYPIAKLVCELMYVPRGRIDEELPGSIHEAKKQLELMRQKIKADEEAAAAAEAESRRLLDEEMRRKKAEEQKKKDEEKQGIVRESSLSQLGGDCRYWRRRYFKLNKATDTLTAYSETSFKPRVSINLRKAVRVVEDKSTLLEPIISTSSGKGRRKSAFAEQEEAFMFVNEGFRIRFADGEIIDFYADNQEQKRLWVKGLRQVIAGARAKEAEEKEKKERDEKDADGKEKLLKKQKEEQTGKIEIPSWMVQIFAYEEEQANPGLYEWRQRKKREKEQKEITEPEKNEQVTTTEKKKGDGEKENMVSADGQSVANIDQTDDDRKAKLDTRIQVTTPKTEGHRESTSTLMNDFTNGESPLVLPKRNRGTKTVYI